MVRIEPRPSSYPCSWDCLLGVSAVMLLAGPALGQCSASLGPDLIVGDISTLQSVGATSPNQGLAIGYAMCNIGSAPVICESSTPRHPAVAANLYRYRVVEGSGRFEQVGMSWCHHEFLLLQQLLCCPSCVPVVNGMGTGCSSSTSVSSDGAPQTMGPRWQVTKSGFPYPPANPPFAGSPIARRLIVTDGDLVSTIASSSIRYYAEAIVVAADDAQAGHRENNASSRRFDVIGGGSTWNFVPRDSTNRDEPAAAQWDALDPGVSRTTIDVPNDGRIEVFSKATDLGNGTWHYEYAVFNLGSDRGVGAVRVPLTASVGVTNTGFHGVAHHSGDGPGNIDFSSAAWSSSRGASSLDWATETIHENALANAIRWGTMYNFRFDADAPPVIGRAALDLWATGGAGEPARVFARVPVPGGCACPGDLDNGSGQGTQDCAVDINDLLYFLTKFEAGDIAIDLDNGSGTGIHDDAVDINDLLYFLVRFEGGC